MRCHAARALDKYFELRQASDNAPAKPANGATDQTIDPRLENIVERMIARCCADQRWHQALGVCLEARRFAKLEEVIRASDSLCASLRYILKACDAVVSRHVRDQAFQLVVKLFAEAGELTPEDNVLRCKSLMVLDDAEQVADIIASLVASSDERKYLLALQIAFDLFDNDVYVRSHSCMCSALQRWL